MNIKIIYWIFFCFIEKNIIFRIKEVSCRYFCEGEDRFILDGRCFVLNRTAVTWHEAKDSCEKQGYILAALNSRDLLQVLSSEIEKYHITSVWLGASDIMPKEKYSWIATNESLPSTYELMYKNGSPHLSENCFEVYYNNLPEIHTHRHCIFPVYYFCMASNNDTSATCDDKGKEFHEGGCFVFETGKIKLHRDEIYCSILIVMRARQQKQDFEALNPKQSNVWIITNIFDMKPTLWIEIKDTIKNETRVDDFDDHKSDCVGFVLELNLVDFPCDFRHYFMCMDIEKDSVYIKNFMLGVNESETNDLFIQESGSNLNFSCTAETNSLPSNMSITKDGRVTQVWLQNSSSLSLIKQNIDCNEIGQYTCEIEDMGKRIIHRKHIYVWVRECGPKLCQKESTEHKVSIGDMTNVTLKICLLMLASHTISKTEIVLIKFSNRFPLEFKKRYTFFSVGDETPVNSILHVDIFNISLKDVGYYEFKVYFQSGHSILYNFSISGNDKLEQSGAVNMFPHFGIAIILIVILAFLGAFLGLVVFRKRTTDLVTDNKENNPLDTDNVSTEYMSVDELDDVLNLAILNTYDTTDDIAENITYNVRSCAQNIRPLLPPRPENKSDYMYADEKQTLSHLEVYQKQATSTKKNSASNEKMSGVNIKDNDIHNIEVNDMPQPELTYASLEDIFVKSYIVTDRNDCKEVSVSNQHVDQYFSNQWASSAENIEKKSQEYIELSNYSFIGNYSSCHQYAKFAKVTSDNDFVKKQGLFDYITPKEVVYETGLHDYIALEDEVYAMGLHDYITPKKAVYSMGLNDYITPNDAASYMFFSDYISSIDTDVLRISKKKSMIENNYIVFDGGEDTTYKEDHYVLFDGDENITDFFRPYIVFDGSEFSK